MQDELTIRDAFAAAVDQGGERPFLHYFDSVFSYREVDRQSDALAAALQESGFAKGDRFCAQSQSIPQFIVALLAVWKLGGIFVPANPMFRARELGLLFEDAQPKVFMAEPHLLMEVYEQLEVDHRPSLVLTASAFAYGPIDERVAPKDALDCNPSYGDVLELVARFDGQKPADISLTLEDSAALVYTSGTTGVPKGAICTQQGLALGGAIARESHALPQYGVVLTLAPLFHITGIVMTVTMAINAAASVVLSYRFHPEVIIAAIDRLCPSVSAGSITAFIAIMNSPTATPEVIAKLKTPMSGGAPVPAAVAAEYQRRFGVSLRTGYGLTETTGAAFMEPLTEPCRIDPASGSLSVGKVLPTFTARVVDETGNELRSGEEGEVVISGPCVSPGYWRKAEDTASSMRSDGFYTGDVGFFDADGWLYLVDRKKDMIIASGYKVWPREVEDVIYSHPAIREAAVVGAPDAYRGETVKAVVSLKPGATLTTDELEAFCRQRLAAYKAPREISIVAELPKNASGKILRRELRG